MDVIAGETRSTVKKSVPFPVGRGTGPRRASERNGKRLCLRAFFAQIDRSRGTGPRATGQEGVRLAMRRSGAGAPELQSLANPINLANPAPGAWRGTGPRPTVKGRRS